MKTYDEIIQRNILDSAVLNYGFMHNVSQLVTRVASLGLNDNPTPQNVLLAKIKTKNSKKDQSNSLPLDQVPNQIQDLNKDQADITLSTLHLLHILLNKNFGFDKADITDMQQHCLHLHGIIKDVKLNRNTDFMLKSNILY